MICGENKIKNEWLGWNLLKTTIDVLVAFTMP